MNERIRELAKQALPNVKYWDEEFIPGTLGISIPDTRATNLKELEKFAELIVRECMRMCDVAAVGYETHGHIKEANGCYSAKEYIEEHFGVD